MTMEHLNLYDKYHRFMNEKKIGLIHLLNLMIIHENVEAMKIFAKEFYM